MTLSKKINLLLIGCFCVLQFSCDNTPSKETNFWKITGTFNSEITGYARLQNYVINSDDKTTFTKNDSVLIKDGSFTFSQKNSDNQFNVYMLSLLKNESFYAFIPIRNGEELTLAIDLKNDITTYKGTSIAKDLNSYMQFEKEKSILYNLEYQTIKDSILQEEEKIKVVDSIGKEINVVFEKTKTFISKIETPFLSSFLAFEELLQSPFDKSIFKDGYDQLNKKAKEQPYGKLIHRIVTNFDAYVLNYFSKDLAYTTLKNEFEALSLDDQNSMYGKAIHQTLKKLNALKIGKPVPELLAKTTDGKLFDLKDLRTVPNGLILLDFWASWCGPCRAENPNYIRLKEKFGKKLTIVGYSFDTDAERWKKAIEKDKLTWINVSNLKSKAEDPVGDDFQIGGIPANLLIQNSIIIGRNLHGQKLEEFITKNTSVK